MKRQVPDQQPQKRDHDLRQEKIISFESPVARTRHVDSIDRNMIKSVVNKKVEVPNDARRVISLNDAGVNEIEAETPKNDNF